MNEGFAPHHRMLGRVSCWGALIMGLVYTVFAILTRMNNPASVPASFNDPFLPLASILLVPIAAFMISSMAAVHAYAPPGLRVYSQLSLVFMSLAMGITTIINFAVFFILTHPIEMTAAPWLSLFIPYKRPGLFSELDLVAWSWFFGLSMIAAAPVFKEDRLEKILRILMFATGILSVVGWTMMILVPSAELLAWVLQAFGWGVLILVVWFLLARVFDRSHPVTGRRGTRE
jgi:hypothetical protein